MPHSDKIKQSPIIPMHALFLRFNGALEGDYWQWSSGRLLSSTRVGALGMTLMVLVYAAIDWLSLDGAFASAWQLRFGAMLPLCLLGFLATYYTLFQQRIRWLGTALATAIIGVQMAIVLTITWPSSQVLMLQYFLTIVLLYYMNHDIVGDFLDTVCLSAATLLMIIAHIYIAATLTSGWQLTGVLVAVVAIVISVLVTHRKYAQNRQLFYYTRGQARFSEKVQAMHTSDPVIKRVESPINQMYQAISDVIWFITTDGRIVYISPSVKEFLGYEPDELIDKRAITLMPLHVYQTFDHKTSRLYKDVTIVRDVFTFKTKAGLLKRGDTHIRAYADKTHGDGFIGTTRPVSEARVKQEANSAKRLEQLQTDNAELKRDNHVLHEDIQTLSEKLTALNRQMTAKGQMDPLEFTEAIAAFGDAYRDEFDPIISEHQQSLTALQTRFEQKTMGKYDLKSYIKNAACSLDYSRNMMHYYQNATIMLQKIVENDIKQFEKNSELHTLFQKSVLELKWAFQSSSHLVDIHCHRSIATHCDADALAILVKHLLLKSLTHSLAEVEKGSIVIDAKRIDGDLIITYSDSGNATVQDPFEQLMLNYVSARGYNNDNTALFVNSYVRHCLDGSVTIDNNHTLAIRIVEQTI